MAQRRMISRLRGPQSLIESWAAGFTDEFGARQLQLPGKLGGTVQYTSALRRLNCDVEERALGLLIPKDQASGQRTASLTREQFLDALDIRRTRLASVKITRVRHESDTGGKPPAAGGAIGHSLHFSIP